MNGKSPAQNSRGNVIHLIGISPLDAGNIIPPRAINDASWATKRQ